MKNGIFQTFRVKQSWAANRLELPDFVRGLAILLVLLHHSMIPYGDWILAFHMPLLFLLSGYTEFLLGRTWEFGPYLKNRVLRLVVPYFLFEGVNLLVWSVSLSLQGSSQNLSDAVYAIVTCLNTDAYSGYYGRLWFLPCMFVSDVIFFWVKKVCGNHKAGLWLSVVILLGLSWCTCNLLPSRLPFAMDTACMASAFLVLGYILGEQISLLMHKKNLLADALLLGLALVIMRISVVYGRGYCLMFINNYGPFLWSVAAAASGSAAFLVLAKWMYACISRIHVGKNLVLWYGYHSLAVFPVHLSIKIAFLRNVTGPLRSWYLLMLAMVVLTIPIVNFITQYLPFMLGKFPVVKKKEKSAS